MLAELDRITRPTWEELRGADLADVHLDWRTGRTRIVARGADRELVVVVTGTRSLRCPRGAAGRVLRAHPTSTEDAAYLRLELATGGAIEVVGTGAYLEPHR